MMAQFVKLALITSGSATAIYLMYKFWKNRNTTEIPATNSEVGEDECTEEFSKEEVVKTCSEERIEKNDPSDSVLKNDVKADDVKLWIDEYVEEYYSINPGPSFYDNIKQDIFDSLVDSDVCDEWNPESVKRYVQDYLDSERPVLIQKDSSSDACDASPDVRNASPDACDVSSSQRDVDNSDDDSDVEQEIENMCNRFFGITYEEYRALEEERFMKLTENDQVNADSVLLQKEKDRISNKVPGGSVENPHALEEKDDEEKKKSHKKWKGFKKRVVKFFKGSKAK